MEARTVVNRIPNPGRFPFEYTINAYRGCSNACVYCLAGDTPILMADGTVRPISRVRRGDIVVGTARSGTFLEYGPAQVLDQRESYQPAVRVDLSDGSYLIASPDHRFLSNRGWKHVQGAEQGASRRPHLTVNNWLLGTGPLPQPPKKDDQYELGYLAGIIHGDGSIGTYDYPLRIGTGGTRVHRFRLALADHEALDRAETFLLRHGVPTTRFSFARQRDGYRPIEAIRAQKEALVARVRSLVRIPSVAREQWIRGFLAGIFDAEGSGGTESLRIANQSEETIELIADCLSDLGFLPAVDRTPSGEPRSIRFLGGLAERVRFVAMTEPAISRKGSIEGHKVKRLGRRQIVAITPLDVVIPMYDLTTSTGDFLANGVISHNCFARPTHDYLGLNIGSDFDSKIVVKINAPAVVRHETAPARWARHPIAMGTNTDPYQSAEGKYKLTRQIIEVLTERKNPFSILTKSPLVLRDLDVLKEAAAATDVQVDLSIGTLDEVAWSSSEPGTAHPQKRLDAVSLLNEAGIPSGVLMAPILPGLSDSEEQLEAVIAGAVAANARFIAGMYLHLRGPLKDHYLDWLADSHPDLLRRHQSGYATSAYTPADASKRLSETIQRLVEKHGGPTRDHTWARVEPDGSPNCEQLTLAV